MITEQELKDKCTPDIIKRMVELAEGFSNYEYNHSLNRAIFDSIYHDVLDIRIFPLLVHRAVEGWNMTNDIHSKIDIGYNGVFVCFDIDDIQKDYLIENYQPLSLTHAECAMLDCLIDILTGQEGRDE